VPYKGGPPIVQDLLAGQIATALNVVSNVLPHVQAGRLRALLMAHVRLRNRLTGGLLVGAGVGLALARRP